MWSIFYTYLHQKKKELFFFVPTIKIEKNHVCLFDTFFLTEIKISKIFYTNSSESLLLLFSFLERLSENDVSFDTSNKIHFDFFLSLFKRFMQK